MLSSQADGSMSADDCLRDVAGHLNRNDAAAALARLKPLLAETPPSIAARFALAMTAWRLERFDWALSLLHECHSDAPDNGGVAEALASLQAQLGQLENSLFTGKLATALGNDPTLAALVPDDYPNFDRAFLSIVEKPLLDKARIAFAEGKLHRATEFARQHVAVEPRHLEGRIFYAQCLMRAGLASAVVETLSLFDETPLAADFASLYARALTAVGERQSAARWHRQAAEAAKDDAEISAAQIADAPFLGLDATAIERLSRDWVARFALAPKPARKHRSGRKLVIGYLVSAFIDPDDATAVATVARAHDRARVTVLGFGLGGQTAEQNSSLIGAFSQWRDIGALDPATLARTLSGDGVDVLIDAGGFASARQLQALTRFDTGLRVSWLGNPAGILAPLYDARLGAGDYPMPEGRAGDASRGEGPIAFGADVSLAQLDARTVALWAGILASIPEAKLVLRARDMEERANVARLVAQFGHTLAARIDLRSAASTSEFYQVVDVALLPRCGASPRAAAEALANGVPTVAMIGAPYGEFLAALGLGKRFVAEDGAQYCSIATSLAQSREAEALPAFESDGAKLAQAIEELGASFNRRENAA
jgi:predicted O-linked N-acetylglucosamine transferase (SPINDLY family)